MKLSEIKGEQALDVWADIVIPIEEIVTDTEVREAFKISRLKGVSVAIKRHKKAVVEIMALIDGENPDTYEYNALTLPKKFLEIFNDEAMQTLFS